MCMCYAVRQLSLRLLTANVRKPCIYKFSRLRPSATACNRHACQAIHSMAAWRASRAGCKTQI